MSDNPEMVAVPGTKEKRRIRKPEVNVFFDKAGKIQPDGFKKLSVDQLVTCTVTGVVKRLEDSNEDWRPGKSIEIEVKKFEIEGEEPKTSLSEAMENAQAKV